MSNVSIANIPGITGYILRFTHMSSKFRIVFNNLSDKMPGIHMMRTYGDICGWASMYDFVGKLPTETSIVLMNYFWKLIK